MYASRDIVTFPLLRVGQADKLVVSTCFAGRRRRRRRRTRRRRRRRRREEIGVKFKNQTPVWIEARVLNVPKNVRRNDSSRSSICDCVSRSAGPRKARAKLLRKLLSCYWNSRVVGNKIDTFMNQRCSQG